MPTLTDGALFGLGTLIFDFVVWRFVHIKQDNARFAFRALIFGLSSYVLFGSGINPLRAAPWDGQPLRHLLAQVLEMAWWFQGARLVTVMLDRVVLPETWHKERLFRDVLNALVFLAAAVGAIAFVLQLPVRGLLATSGAFAIIIGLAVQSTLNDVFSGVVLNATQPFRLGDWITIGDIDGKVVETSWRSTSLLNDQGNLVVIPNSVASRTNIINANRPSDLHGISIVLPLALSIRPADALAALSDAVTSCVDLLERPAPRVNVRRATHDAIEYEIVCHVDSLENKGEVRNALFDLAYRHLVSRGVIPHSTSLPGAELDAVSRKCHLLHSVRIFQTLPQEDISELAAKLTEHEFDAAQTIYAAADGGGHELHILARGVATVTAPKEDGESELRRMAPGDSVGQSGILAGMRSDVTVRAMTRVVVLRLDKDALTPILARRPEMAREMCRLLSEHEATEKSLLATSAYASESGGLLNWIRDGMRRLHELTF